MPEEPELPAGALELLGAAELGSVAAGGGMSLGVPGMLELESVAPGIAPALSVVPVAPDVPEAEESGVVIVVPDVLLVDVSGNVLLDAASGSASRLPQPTSTTVKRLAVRISLEALDRDFIADPFTDY